METVEEKKTFATEGGHWYKKDGTPCYEVENKSKGGMRATTLRDAKKLGLVPSVTAICNQVAKPGLLNWIVEQAYMSCYTCPIKRDDVSAEEWIARVKADAREQSEKAREEGTKIHGEMEKFLQGGFIDPLYKIRALKVLDILKEYGVDMGLETEKAFACEKYGGKIDILHKEEGFVADIKTTEFTLDGDNKPNKGLIWPEHILQLAGYSDGLPEFNFRPSVKLVNVYVSTINDDVWHHVWKAEDYIKASKKFELLTKLWWITNIGE